jgi:hypothetical protein
MSTARALDEAGAVLGLGHIALDGDAAAPERLDHRLRVVQPVNSPRAERDIGACFRERPREVDPEAGRRTRHDRDLAVELEPVEHTHVRSLSSSVVTSRANGR